MHILHKKSRTVSNDCPAWVYLLPELLLIRVLLKLHLKCFHVVEVIDL